MSLPSHCIRFKLQRHQKSQLLLSTLSKKGLFITAVAFFYSWGDRSSTHPLGYAINWFRFGKLLNTTNGWDLVSLYFPGNPSSTFWFAGLYIQWNWDPKWTEKGVHLIVMFPFSVSIVFLNVRQTLWQVSQECHQTKLIGGASFFSQWYFASSGQSRNENLY